MSERRSNEVRNAPNGSLRERAMILRKVPGDGAGKGEDDNDVSHGHPDAEGMR